MSEAAVVKPLHDPGRRRDRERTREDILEVATSEFADRGYSGARVDEIGARTRTTKRMIYYYFGSKEGLWIAVLERAYNLVRVAEQELHIEDLEPREAIRRLAELTFDHHESHPDFIRIVSDENMYRAEHMRKAGGLASLSVPAVDVISQILERGTRSGVFRRRVDAVDVHMMISAFCFFRVSNRNTFGVLFDRDLLDSTLRGHYRTMLGDLLVDYLCAKSEPLNPY